MAKQYAFIGLDSFSIYVLEKLHEVTNEIIIIDKDDTIIERFKHWAKKAHIVDLRSADVIEQSIGETVDTAIVDVGNNMETAIIIISTLKKLNIPRILVCCETKEQGNIYSLVGATQIIIPAREAASRVVPLLVSGNLLNFSPISPSLIMAEVKIPSKYAGKTLVEANFRQAHGINVVAIRKIDSDDYFYFEPNYRLTENDVLLSVGSIEKIESFTGTQFSERKGFWTSFFNTFFSKKS